MSSNPLFSPPRNPSRTRLRKPGDAPPCSPRRLFPEPQSPAQRKVEPASPRGRLALTSPARPIRQTTLSSAEQVKVYLRIRPVGDKQPECFAVNDEATVTFADPRRDVSEQFSFTKVLGHRATQQEVFDTTTSRLVDDLLSGRDALLFAYGCTNAGKSHTIQGNKKHPGIIPRTMAKVFSALEEAEVYGPQRRVVISFFEIYNDSVFDLLAKDKGMVKDPNCPNGVKRRALDVMRSIETDRLHIQDLEEVEVDDEEVALEYFASGLDSRQVAHTLLNDDSSRSHAVFQLKIVQADNEATFHIVDLAGSERLRRTQASGARQREAGNINNSLLTLGTCIQNLRYNQQNPDKPQRVIPFRDSKVTRLFQVALESGAHVVMVVAVHPGVSEAQETSHVLKYAAIASEVVSQKVERTLSRNRVPALQLGKVDRHQSGVQALGNDELDLSNFDLEAMGEDDLELEQSVEELLNENDMLKARLCEAEAKVIQTERDVRAEAAEEMADALKDLEDHYRARLNDTVQRLQASHDLRMRALQAELAAVGPSAPRTPEPNAALVAKVAELEEELETFRELDNADTEAQHEQLQAELQEAKDAKDELHAELREARKTEKKLRAALQEAMEVAEALQAELRDVREAEAEVRGELQDARDAEEELRTALRGAKEAEAEVRGELQEARDAEEELKRELVDRQHTEAEPQMETEGDGDDDGQVECEGSDEEPAAPATPATPVTPPPKPSRKRKGKDASEAGSPPKRGRKGKGKSKAGEENAGPNESEPKKTTKKAKREVATDGAGLFSPRKTRSGRKLRA